MKLRISLESFTISLAVIQLIITVIFCKAIHDLRLTEAIHKSQLAEAQVRLEDHRAQLETLTKASNELYERIKP